MCLTHLECNDYELSRCNIAQKFHNQWGLWISNALKLHQRLIIQHFGCENFSWCFYSWIVYTFPSEKCNI